MVSQIGRGIVSCNYPSIFTVIMHVPGITMVWLHPCFSLTTERMAVMGEELTCQCLAAESDCLWPWPPTCHHQISNLEKEYNS